MRLPIYEIRIDGELSGAFYWDGRLNQLRAVDNPHEYTDLTDYDEPCPGDFGTVQIGGSFQIGGGASPLYEYTRVS